MKKQKKAESGMMNFDEDTIKELKSLTEKTDNIEKGKFINDALNNNVSSFIPDLLAKNITKNYHTAKEIYGPKIMRYITGYSSEFLDRNMKIPEFQKELFKKIQDNIEKLKRDDILDKNYNFTEKAKELTIATQLFIEFEKLDKLMQSDLFGKYIHKYRTNIHGGEKLDVRNFRKSDSYKDIAMKSSVKLALRRGHKELDVNDLRTFDKSEKANLAIVFAIDSSSSMKGDKIDAAKKSALSLAYKTISDHNKLGLIDFSDKINKASIMHSFHDAANFIYDITTNAQTDLSKVITHSISMFPQDSNVKHLVLLSDIEPTKSAYHDIEPEDATLNAIAVAKANNISISIILIDQDGKQDVNKFVAKIIEVSDGKLYKVRNIEDLDALVIDDYYSVS